LILIRPKESKKRNEILELKPLASRDFVLITFVQKKKVEILDWEYSNISLAGVCKISPVTRTTEF